ncbi:putative glucose-1-phosphate adenylyltransferase [Helianthus anomalus]
MLGAHYNHTESEIASLLANGKVLIGFGSNTKIRYKYMSNWISLKHLKPFVVTFVGETAL